MGDGTKPADAVLWARVVAGDTRAFERLFDRHANSIFVFCARRTGDWTAAEDLMSATFLHAWRRRTDMEPAPDGPVPWFYGIAANLVRRHLRSVGRSRAAMARTLPAEVEPDPSDEIAARVDNARRLDRTLKALRSLSETDQDLFVLCVWQQLTYEEAAAALGIAVGTVRSRLSRARSRLRLVEGEPTRDSGDERDETSNMRDRREGGSHG